MYKKDQLYYHFIMQGLFSQIQVNVPLYLTHSLLNDMYVRMYMHYACMYDFCMYDFCMYVYFWDGQAKYALKELLYTHLSRSKSQCSKIPPTTLSMHQHAFQKDDEFVSER